MNNKIVCTVDKCTYNENKNCVASTVDVCNCGCHEATHSDQTACRTFKEKD